MLTQRRYPNRLDLDAVIGSTAWAVVATDGTNYPSLAALKAAGKRAWPHSYTLNGVIQPGIELNEGLGPLLAQSDSGGQQGSPFYLETGGATAPTSDNPASLVTTSLTMDDIGTLWCVWVRMTSPSDKLRLTIRY